MVLTHTDLPADTEHDKSQDQQPTSTRSRSPVVRTTEEALTNINATRPEKEHLEKRKREKILLMVKNKLFPFCE